MNNAQSAMGRKRTKDFGLPPRVYCRGANHYYVDLGGRWHPLGKDEAVMRHRWAEMHGVEQTATLSVLVARYMAECMGKAAVNTVKQYQSYQRTIDDEWGAHSPDAILPPILARWRDTVASEIRANGTLSLLRVSYAKGIEWGLCTTNPARAVAFLRQDGRGRYMEDSEARAIREHLPPWAQTWMDISYVTGLRASDVLSLRWDEVGDVIERRSQKTKTKQTYRVDGDLKDILNHARSKPIVGLYVVANAKGRPMGISRLQEVWKAAREAAGVKDIQARDVRAKAGTDAKAQGLDYQAMLGHQDPRTSELYIRTKQTMLAPTLRRRY